MNPALRLTLVIATPVLLAGAAVAVRSAHARPSVARYDIAGERERHDADIEFYRQRVRRDPTGALDHLRLALLYLQRARERASPGDILRAENEARASLNNRRAHNTEAWHALALALMGQHRFVEALAAADSLLAPDPMAEGPRSLVGEIDLELGRYPAADSIFASLDRGASLAPILSRVARWSAVRGRASHAWSVLLSARERAHRQSSTPAEQIAWYDLRLGELALSVGRTGDAAERLALARDVAPDDPRVLLALARLALTQHRPAAALDAAHAAMNAGEDPLAFALASDAARALGDSAEAGRMFAAFRASIDGVPPAAWHRQWRIELLDRGVDVDRVLADARTELATRPDVYGWDQYAWALHHAGRDGEARAAMREALRWGTEDVTLDAHAAALGVSR